MKINQYLKMSVIMTVFSFAAFSGTVAAAIVY